MAPARRPPESIRAVWSRRRTVAAAMRSASNSLTCRYPFGAAAPGGSGRGRRWRPGRPCAPASVRPRRRSTGQRSRQAVSQRCAAGTPCYPVRCRRHGSGRASRAAAGASLRREIDAVRGEMETLRANVGTLRGEVAEVRHDLHALSDRVARIEGALTGPWRPPANGGASDPVPPAVAPNPESTT